MIDIQTIPYYLFFIIRPDGNTAYTKIHEQFPLDLDINQLLTIGSSLKNLNTMQCEIIHPDIKNNRKNQLDLEKHASIRSIKASTFQMRMYDTINGYLFVITAGNNIDSKKLDGKLEEVYRSFVNYIIKAPFFNNTEKIDNPTFIKKCNQILHM